MSLEEERLLILQMVAENKITAAEAAELLRALEGMPAPPAAPAVGLGDWLENMLGKIANLVSFGAGIDVHEEYQGPLTGDQVQVDLHVPNGRLCVYAWDRPEYKAVITKKVRASSEEEARRIGLELAPFVVNAQGVRFVARDQIFDLHQATLDLYLPRPLVYGLSARTGNGRVEVEGLTGTAGSLRTGNGRVRVEGGAWGRLDVHTGNGSVKVRTDAADLGAHSGNGSLELALLGARTGRVTGNTGNGSITVDTSAIPAAALSVDLHTGVGGLHDRSGREWENYRMQDEFASKKLIAQTRGYAGAAAQVHVKARTGVGSVTLL